MSVIAKDSKGSKTAEGSRQQYTIRCIRNQSTLKLLIILAEDTGKKNDRKGLVFYNEHLMWDFSICCSQKTFTFFFYKTSIGKNGIQMQ